MVGNPELGPDYSPAVGMAPSKFRIARDSLGTEQRSGPIRAIPNFCARDLGHLAHRARRHLRSMQGQSTLVFALWRQAELF
jgi:hypothetical protein